MAKKDNSGGQNTLHDETGKSRNKKKSSGVFSSLKAALNDIRLQRVTGLLLILLSVYTFVAFFIYLFSWQGDDQLTGISFWRIFTDQSIVASNYGGRLGAALSNLFIKQWFGVASFLFPVFFFVAGVRLFINTTLLNLSRFARHSLFLLLLISVSISFIFTSTPYLLYGGAVGFEINNWLCGLMGKLGTVLLILFSGITWLIFTFNLNFNWLKDINKKTANDKTEEIASPSIPNTNKINTEEPTADNEDDKFSEEGVFDLEVGGTNKPSSIKTSGDLELIIENTTEITPEIEPEEEITDSQLPKPEHYGLDTEFDPTL